MILVLFGFNDGMVVSMGREMGIILSNIIIHNVLAVFWLTRFYAKRVGTRFGNNGWIYFGSTI